MDSEINLIARTFFNVLTKFIDILLIRLDKRNRLFKHFLKFYPVRHIETFSCGIHMDINNDFVIGFLNFRKNIYPVVGRTYF